MATITHPALIVGDVGIAAQEQGSPIQKQVGKQKIQEMSRMVWGQGLRRSERSSPALIVFSDFIDCILLLNSGFSYVPFEALIDIGCF